MFSSTEQELLIDELSFCQLNETFENKFQNTLKLDFFFFTFIVGFLENFI